MTSSPGSVALNFLSDQLITKFNFQPILNNSSSVRKFTIWLEKVIFISVDVGQRW
jgi:hypothetical protein